MNKTYNNKLTWLGLLLLVALVGCQPRQRAVSMSDALEFASQVAISSDQNFLAIIVGRRDFKTKQHLDRKITIVDSEDGSIVKFIPLPFSLALSWKPDVSGDILYFIESGERRETAWPIDVLRNYNVGKKQFGNTATQLTSGWIPYNMKWSPDGNILCLVADIYGSTYKLGDVGECGIAISVDNGITFQVVEMNPQTMRFCWADNKSIFVQNASEIKAGRITPSGIDYYELFAENNAKRLLGSFCKKPLWVSEHFLFLGHKKISEINDKRFSCYTDGVEYLAIQSGDNVNILNNKLGTIHKKRLPDMRLIGICSKQKSLYLLSRNTRDTISTYNFLDGSLCKVVSVADLSISMY